MEGGYEKPQAGGESSSSSSESDSESESGSSSSNEVTGTISEHQGKNVVITFTVYSNSKRIQVIKGAVRRKIVYLVFTLFKRFFEMSVLTGI